MVHCTNCGSPMTGNVCQRCGWSAIQTQTPYQSPIQPQAYQQPPPGGGGMVIVFAVIIIVVVAALAVVFLIVFSDGDSSSNGGIGETETTPKGSLFFTEDPNVAGRYYITFQGSIENTNLEIRITDASTGQSAVMDEPIDGEFAAVGSGMNITYDDANNNQKLDAADQLLIQNGDTSDELTVVYKPTGEIVARATLS